MASIAMCMCIALVFLRRASHRPCDVHGTETPSVAGWHARQLARLCPLASVSDRHQSGFDLSPIRSQLDTLSLGSPAPHASGSPPAAVCRGPPPSLLLRNGAQCPLT